MVSFVVALCIEAKEAVLGYTFETDFKSGSADAGKQKDSSQETVISLMGMLVGMIFPS